MDVFLFENFGVFAVDGVDVVAVNNENLFIIVAEVTGGTTPTADLFILFRTFCCCADISTA